MMEIMEQTNNNKDLHNLANRLLAEGIAKFVEKNTKDIVLNEEQTISLFKESFFAIRNVLLKFIELDPKDYDIVALWILGTYVHEHFPSYAYLFFNAMKGSGKSRTLQLVTKLAKEGKMVNDVKAAALFRGSGTLGIDEFEGSSTRRKENLVELINSAYKKGVKIQRAKEVQTRDGKDYELEEFDVYRPIAIANISGLSETLEDRSITIYLKKSNSNKTKLLEHFEEDIDFLRSFAFLGPIKMYKCTVLYNHIYLQKWNKYLIGKDNTLTTHTTLYTDYTYYTLPTTLQNIVKMPHQEQVDLTAEEEELFTHIYDSGINGRQLELCFPLLLLANTIDKNLFFHVLRTFEERFAQKRQDDKMISNDHSLIEFVAQYPDSKYKRVVDLVSEFREFLSGGTSEEWLNSVWMGKALRRNGLVLDKKRMTYGWEVLLNKEAASDMLSKLE